MARDPFDEATALLNQIMNIFDLQDLDQPTPTLYHQRAIHVEQSCRVGSTFVDDNLVRPTVTGNRLAKKAVAAASSRRSDSMKSGV